MHFFFLKLYTLCDLPQGRVVGLNIWLPDGSPTRCGYAVPIDTVRSLVQHIQRFGKVQRPSMGITVAPRTVLEQLGIEGVLILDVPAGSPAAAAGMRPTYRDVSELRWSDHQGCGVSHTTHDSTIR